MPASAGGRPLVVLPSYNGARRLPVLTPLLALLLARKGLPVLLHGTATEDRRVLASDVLAALGMAPLEAPAAIAPGQRGAPVHGRAAPRPGAPAGGAPDAGPAHAGAQRGQAARALRGPGAVGEQLHPCRILRARGRRGGAREQRLHLLLSRGLEGEVAADPRRPPHYDGFVAGRHTLLAQQRPGTDAQVPGLPRTTGVASTAPYTRDVLGGHLPVPAALAEQVRHVARLAAQITPSQEPS